MTDLKSAVVCSILPDGRGSGSHVTARIPDRCGQVEIRADRLNPGLLAELVTRSCQETIVTVRSRSEGGLFTGSEQERANLLVAGIEAGARYVDVEFGSGMDATLHSRGIPADRL